MEGPGSATLPSIKKKRKLLRTETTKLGVFDSIITALLFPNELIKLIMINTTMYVFHVHFSVLLMDQRTLYCISNGPQQNGG